MSDPTHYDLDAVQQGELPPWKVLLRSVVESASPIAEEVLSDAVLGESIATAAGSFESHHEKLAALRHKFAKADELCMNLRREARDLMSQGGYGPDWNSDDIQAVDAQLAIALKEAAANASDINRMRAEASALDNQLLGRAVDEISLCSSIAVLRNIEKYQCEGEAFCVAYLATAMVREKSVRDVPAAKAVDALADWLQYAVGIKTRVVEYDIYAHSRVAAGIGRGMGIANSVALRIALIEAMKKIRSR
ncbi:MAG TPA: hypothetical protein VF798_01980 [Burkholderiaceae bacterium]